MAFIPTMILALVAKFTLLEKESKKNKICHEDKIVLYADYADKTADSEFPGYVTVDECQKNIKRRNKRKKSNLKETTKNLKGLKRKSKSPQNDFPQAKKSKTSRIEVPPKLSPLKIEAEENAFAKTDQNASSCSDRNLHFVKPTTNVLPNGLPVESGVEEVAGNTLITNNIPYALSSLDILDNGNQYVDNSRTVYHYTTTIVRQHNQDTIVTSVSNVGPSVPIVKCPTTPHSPPPSVTAHQSPRMTHFNDQPDRSNNYLVADNLDSVAPSVAPPFVPAQTPQPKEKTTKKNLPPAALIILRSFLYNNYLKYTASQDKEDLYPTDVDKMKMVADTHLTKDQVCNWLINARRRDQLMFDEEFFDKDAYISGRRNSIARTKSIPAQ